jgi:hypothetical protein
VSAVVGRRHSVGLALLGPARSAGGADPEWPELVEGEGAIGELFQHFLDPVEFAVSLGIGGFLPGLGSLECDPAAAEQAAQRFPPDPDRLPGGGLQIASEFADRPASERLAEFRRAGSGRRHDEIFLVKTEQAGTASRPLRVQTGQPDLVERVNHVADGVLIGRHQSRDHWDPIASREGQDDHRPPVPHRAGRAATHDPLQLLPFLISQPANFHWLCHHASAPDSTVSFHRTGYRRISPERHTR